MSFARQIRFYIYVLIAVIVAFSVFVGGFYLWHQLERDRVLESLRYHRLNTQLLDEIQVELLQFKLELGKRDTASGGAGEPTVVSAKSVIRKRKYNGMLHLISSRMEQLLTSQRPHTEAMTAPAMARVKNRFAEFKSIITRLVYGEGSLSQVDTTQVDIFYTSLEQLKRLHNILYQDDADEHSESDRRDVPILALIILATLCMGAFAVFRLIRQIDHVIARNKRAEEDLRASQLLLRTIFDAIPIPVFVKDAERRFVMVNTAASNKYGLDPVEALGRRADEFPQFFEAGVQAVAMEEKEVMRTGIAMEIPERVSVREDGTEEWHRAIRVPLFDNEGNVTGLVAIREDITERRRTVIALEESRQFLRAVFDTIPSPITVRDRDGNLTMVNKAHVAGTGLTPEQFIALPDRYPLLIQEDAQKVEAANKKVMETGELISEEAPYRWKAGGENYYQTERVPLKNIQGETIGVIVVHQDITERKRAEDNLRQNEAQLQQVFDSIPHTVILKDREGRYLQVNQAACEFWGVTPEQILGSKAADLPGRSEEEFAAIVSSDKVVLDGGEGIRWFQQKLTDSSGNPRSFQTAKTAMKDSEGNVTGLVSVGLDITERVRAEEDLRDSRRLLQTVFDALPVQVFVKDAENKYLMVNRKVLDYSGLTNEDFQGRHVLETPYGTSEQRELFLESDRQVMETGEPFDMANRPYTSKDGDHRIQHVVKVPIKDEEGNVLGVVGVSEDITERVRAEEDLRASQRLLQTVFDTIPVGVFVKNKEGVTIMVNKSHAASMNHRPDFFENKTIQELGIASPDDLARMTEMDQVVLKEGEIVDLPEDQLTMPNGEVKWWHLVKTPLRDDKGDIIGLVGMREDITERKQIDVMKQEFISVVSHELRTPLTSIIGSVGLILGGVGGKIPKKANRLLQIANSNSQRLLRIINDMLYLEKMESGKMDLEMMPVKVCKLVEDAVRENMPYADNYNVQFELRQATGESTVWGNEESLMQVLANLLSNAAKFSTPGGVVVLSADVLESGVQISVSDQGAGVPLEAQESIFDKFFQVDSSDSRSREGTGLGLSISREIVRNHGSELKLESTPGEGSRFYFELPFSSAGGNQEGAATADSQSEAG